MIRRQRATQADPLESGRSFEYHKCRWICEKIMFPPVTFSWEVSPQKFVGSQRRRTDHESQKSNCKACTTTACSCLYLVLHRCPRQRSVEVGLERRIRGFRRVSSKRRQVGIRVWQSQWLGQ